MAESKIMIFQAPIDSILLKLKSVFVAVRSQSFIVKKNKKNLKLPKKIKKIFLSLKSNLDP